MAYHLLMPVGTWLQESFGRLRGRWLTLSALFVIGFLALVVGVLTVYGLGFVIYGSLQGWDNMMRVALDPRKLGYLIDEARGGVALFNLLAAFVALRIYCWILLAAVHASMDPGLGIRDSLRKGKGRGYAFLVLVVVQQLILQLGMVLFILPGLILAVWLGFAFWAFAREESGVFRFLGESARLVKGHFFGVLGRMLLLGLLGGAMMIVPVIGWLIGAAWMFVAWELLYADLRGPAPVKAGPARRAPAAGRIATPHGSTA